MFSQNKIFLASLLIAISGILYGFLGFLGTEILQDNISISTMLFWRFLIAGSWILFFQKWHDLPLKNNTFNKPVLLYTFMLGAIGYAGSSAFYFVASQYTGTGLAMVLFFSYPLLITLFSLLVQKVNINLHTIINVIVMIIGLLLLQHSSTNHISMIGILFGMIAAICYAFYIIGSKHISSIIKDSNLLTIIVSFGCAVIFFIISLSTKGLIFPHSLKSWCYLLMLGIFATALPIQLMLIGLRHVSSVRASIISVLEPLVTVLIGVFLLDESITHLQILGVVIILISALSTQLQKE